MHFFGLILISSLGFSVDSWAKTCPKGKHWVKPHPRRLTGCGTTAESRPKDALSLSHVRTFKLGHTRKTDIARSIGEPSKKLVHEGEDVWAFYDANGGTQRAAFTFQDDILGSVTWVFRGGEKYTKLGDAKKYLNGKFAKLPRRRYDHYVESTRSYVDETNGYSILVDEYHQRVMAISWAIPSKKARVLGGK